MSETNRIEYKLKLTKDVDLEKEVVAFLNYHEGGILYFGIDKDGVVQGVTDLDGDMLKIKDRIKMNVLPSCMGLFDVSAEVKDGLDIIKIILASGSEKPYYKKKYGMSEKGCYIRSGTAADPMPTKMIEELFAKRTRNSIGKIKSTQQDLSFAQLKIYYEAKGAILNDHFAKSLELLTENGDFNLVAYLMADKNNTSIKVAKYNGTSRADLGENAELGYESLIKSVNQVLDKIELENRTRTEITSKERHEKPKWNAIALREAIINAFVHNDYSTEVPPKFEIFDDRIEITSTGGLPDGLSQREYFEGYSVPRNKEIMRIFKDLNLVEQLGSGVPRILEFYDRESVVFSDNFIRMTFLAEIPVKEQVVNLFNEDGAPYNSLHKSRTEFISLTRGRRISSDKGRIYLSENYDFLSEHLRTNFGQLSDEIRTKFGVNVIHSLFLMLLNPEITAKEIAQFLEITQRTVENYISKLKGNQLILREGSDKVGNWRIIEMKEP